MEVKWSESAISDLKIILNYLDNNWGHKVINDFRLNLEKSIEIILRNPNAFPLVENLENTRQFIVTKHNKLIYSVDKNILYIVRLFDTRQKPII